VHADSSTSHGTAVVHTGWHGILCTSPQFLQPFLRTFAQDVMENYPITTIDTTHVAATEYWYDLTIVLTVFFNLCIQDMLLIFISTTG